MNFIKNPFVFICLVVSICLIIINLIRTDIFTTKVNVKVKDIIYSPIPKGLYVITETETFVITDDVLQKNYLKYLNIKRDSTYVFTVKGNANTVFPHRVIIKIQ